MYQNRDREMQEKDGGGYKKYFMLWSRFEDFLLNLHKVISLLIRMFSEK